MTEFQIFVKPVSSTCNLGCSYCYYHSKSNLYGGKSQFLMSDEVLRKYIQQHFEASSDDIITFSWHGGEPLLAGIGFFKRVLEIQSSFKKAGQTILNGIQTNGTLLNDDWCRFLSKENFTIGISIDGPSELHNIYRKRGNKDTFKSVVEGYERLRTYGITAEILCVVNKINVKYPLEVYRFFKQLDPHFLTFIPLVESDPDSPLCVSVRTVPAEEFGYFLAEIFDEWIENDIGRIKIQIFEEALRTAFEQEHTLCIFKRECGGVPVIEHNGDFYSCDHYVNEQHLLGNIMTKKLNDLLDSPEQQAFGRAKLTTLPRYCTDCEVRTMCNGECPKNRFILSPDGEAGLNYLCKGYKYFFNHCKPFVEAVAEEWRR